MKTEQRRTVPLRAGLAIAFTALAVGTMVVMSAVTYFNNRGLVIETARSSMQKAGRDVAKGVGTHLSQVSVAVTAAAAHLGRSDSTDVGLDDLKPFFEPLRHTEQLYGLYLALQGDGAFHQFVRLPPGMEQFGGHPVPIPDRATVVWRSVEVREGMRTSSAIFRDRDETVLQEDEASSTYDPRSRPWYAGAWKQPGLYVSEAYNFASNGGPGITISARINGPEGVPVGVVGADLTLNAVSVLLAQERVGPGGRVFLTNESGAVVATDGVVADPQGAILFEHVANAYHRAASPEFATDAPDGSREYLVSVRPLSQELGAKWQVWVLADEADIVGSIERATIVSLTAGLLVSVLGIVLTLLISKRISGSLHGLASDAGRMRDLDFAEFKVTQSRIAEVNDIAATLVGARDTIRSHLESIEQMTVQRQRLQTQLDIARDIQQSMLPAPIEDRQLPIEVHGELLAARTVGGDFFGYGPLSADRFWFAIGDVSDKGVPAALFMARTLTLLELVASTVDQPEMMLRQVAGQLEVNNEACMFATALCGVIDTQSGCYRIANAGHEAPVLQSMSGERHQLKLEGASPLGFDVQDDYPVVNGRLASGETLLFYTDGVTDALNESGAAFGESVLLAPGQASASPHQLCSDLREAIDAFVGGADRYDDITLLALRWQAPATRQARCS